MNLTRREAWVALGSAAFALSAVMALAAHGDGPPRLIPYQAQLERDGEPVDGPVDLQLALFDDASAGTQLWQEARTGVSVRDGKLGLVLGEATALPAGVFDESQLWLEVTVGGVALEPRQRVLPVAQAVASLQAASFDVAHELRWSTGGWLRDDQGGVLELGDGAQSSTPYVDFHANDGGGDYSNRIIANGEGALTVKGSGGLWVDEGVQAKSVTVTETLSTAKLAVGATKYCSAIIAGVWRSDLPVPDTWTNDDCITFAQSVGATSHTMGCLFRTNVTTTAQGRAAKFSVSATSSSTPPNPNCGW